jgi:hypothetical protein
MNTSFIRRERGELQGVVGIMNNTQKKTLGNQVNRISHLLDLLEKSGLSGKQKQNIAKEVEDQNDNVALSRTLMANVTTSASKHGQSQAIADRLSFEEGSKPIPISKDLYKSKEQVEREPLTRRSFQPNPFSESKPQIVPNNRKLLSENDDDLNNLLSDSEISEIKKASPEARHSIVKGYENDTHKNIEALDNHINTSNAAYKMAGVGLLSGYLADEGTDYLFKNLDPNKKIPQKIKTATSGGVGGALAEVGSSALAGDAISATLVASSAIGGITGGLAGESEYKYLKKKGVDEIQAETGAGATAGGVFGATASIPEIGTVLSVGAEEGASAGLALAGETAGLSVIGGSAIGATLAGSAYEISKAYNYFKNL